MSRTCVRTSRAVALAGGLALVVSLIGETAAGLGAEDQRPRTRSAYVVRAGDSVWAIAERIVRDQSDPRPVVDAIIRTNGVDPGRLLPGQVLQVPVPWTP